MDPLVALSYLGVLLFGYILGRVVSRPTLPPEPTSRTTMPDTPSAIIPPHSIPVSPPFAAQTSRSPGEQSPSANPDADIEELIRNDRLINAIRLYSARYNVDLRQAKDAVEEMVKRMQ